MLELTGIEIIGLSLGNILHFYKAILNPGICPILIELFLKSVFERQSFPGVLESIKIDAALIAHAI